MRLIVAPIVYVRAILGMVFVAALTVVLSGPVFFFGTFQFERSTTFCMWLWSRLVLFFFSVKLCVRGEQNLPRSGGAVLAFNHQSHFDIPALTGATRRTMRYGAKIELFSVPFFGPAVKAAGCLPIARDNRREVLRIYRESAERLRRGLFFALAPEGTRQPEPVIGSFKRGPFIFAAASGVPVVPVIIEGADRVLPKGALFANTRGLVSLINIEFLKPVVAVGSDGQPFAPAAVGDEVPPEIVTDFTARTRELIVQRFQELKELRAQRES